MTVRRLYVPDLPEEGGLVILEEAPSRHVRVLRLRVGDEVVLFDGTGRAAPAHLRSMSGQIVCQAEQPTAVESRRTRLVLMLAVPKGPRIDDCVRMATELGVDEVVLMQSERTIPKWDSRRAQSRLDRLTRIASEAAAQCERNDVPVIHPPQSPAACLEELPENARGFLFGARAKQAMTLEGIPAQLWCAVGPEGGFTDPEVALFKRAGFAVAGLGARVLRVETAVAAALAITQDRLAASKQAR